LKDGTADLDWPSLVRPNQTVVIYMGFSGLPDICQSMIEHGAPSDLPVAVVQDGSSRTQAVVTGTLSNIAEHAPPRKLQVTQPDNHRQRGQVAQ
jgi:uroporphyrin-III C-methyltransferase/precorrin-2 dehydrogenase/sirohydrochlorin ferrochelatase